MRFFTSDHHYFHNAILSYTSRPYLNVEDMNKGLIEIWNSVVKPDDEVYFLGDFSLNINHNVKILPHLNGLNKNLIIGNHDLMQLFHMHSDKALRRAEKMYEKHLSQGWSDVCLYKRIELKNGLPVLLSHLPYIEGTREYDERYLNCRPVDTGLFLLHGHLHKHYLKKKNMIDVGIDGELKIWSEDEIISLIEDERDFIPSVCKRDVFRKLVD